MQVCWCASVRVCDYVNMQLLECAGVRVCECVRVCYIVSRCSFHT